MNWVAFFLGYHGALREWRRWNSLGRPLNYLSIYYAYGPKQQWHDFDEMDRIARGES